MRYPVKIQPDGHVWMATFPDIPEANTAGDTREEALANARDALVTAMDFYFEDGRQVPPPSPAKRGQPLVDLPPSVAVKVLLLNEMLGQKVRPADLARKMGTTRQEVNRLTDLHHPTKVDTMHQALQALGKRLEFSVA